MEPCALAQLEAMASSLALIVSDKKVNGASELLKDEKDALLLKNTRDPKEIAEKIEYLLENRKLIKKFGKKVQMKASKMDWKIISKKYLQLFESVKE